MQVQLLISIGLLKRIHGTLHLSKFKPSFMTEMHPEQNTNKISKVDIQPS
jgi:hypothetical protein